MRQNEECGKKYDSWQWEKNGKKNTKIWRDRTKKLAEFEISEKKEINGRTGMKKKRTKDIENK